jgi:hypothetical protein
VKEITRKYENVQKGVGGLMRGALLETEARKIRDMSRMEGRTEGRTEGRMEAYIDMVREGFISVKEAASRLHISEKALREYMER